MRSKSLVLLGLALGCGLVASIGISQVMDRRNVSDAPAAETEPVFVAAVDINFNDEVTKERIRVEEWPKDKVYPDALRTLDQIKGQRAAHKFFAGEQIRSGKLMGAEGMVSATGKIPAGYRVVAVRVDAVTGAAGLILPNDRVDVLVYLRVIPAPASTKRAPRRFCKTSGCLPSTRSSSAAREATSPRSRPRPFRCWLPRPRPRR